jgi:hypothetical protein
MMFYKDEIVEEVRRTREELLRKYGGITGLRKRYAEERPRFEKERWVFIDHPPVDTNFIAAVKKDLNAG